MGDTGMMDYMLKAVANHSVGPWVVFRYACMLHRYSNSVEAVSNLASNALLGKAYPGCEVQCVQEGHKGHIKSASMCST